MDIEMKMRWGVDLENILKKTADETFFSLELGNGVKQKEVTVWLKCKYLLKNVLLLITKMVPLFVENFKQRKV